MKREEEGWDKRRCGIMEYGNGRNPSKISTSCQIDNVAYI